VKAAVAVVLAIALTCSAWSSGRAHENATSEATAGLDPFAARTVLSAEENTIESVVASICGTRVVRATLAPTATVTPLEADVCR
jgi:hypothetical protein